MWFALKKYGIENATMNKTDDSHNRFRIMKSYTGSDEATKFWGRRLL